MGDGKRPKKELTVNFINSQFACLGVVPGMNEKTIAAQFAHGNYYLYEGEIKGIVEKEQDSDPKFDPKKYVQFLQETNVLRKGEAPSFGGGKVSLNSQETAKFVAANPSNEAEVKEIMRLSTVLVDTRHKVNKLLGKGVTCGIGYNSATRTKKRLEESDKTEGGTPSEEQAEPTKEA